MNIPTLGAELRRLRKRRKWTIYEVAQRIGVSYPMISNYETREIAIPEENLRRLAQLYDVEFEYLQFLSLPIPAEYKQRIAENPNTHSAIHWHLGIRAQPDDVALLHELIKGFPLNDPDRRLCHQYLLDRLSALDFSQDFHAWVRYYQALFAIDQGQHSEGIAELTQLYDDAGPPESPKYLRLWDHTAQQLGRQHSIKGRLYLALPILQACHDHFGRVRDFAGLTLISVQLAELCAEIGDERSIEYYFKYAFNAVGDDRNEFFAITRQHYGAVYVQKQHWDDAEFALSQAAQVWQRLSRPREQLETHLLLSAVFRQQGRWAKAQRELHNARNLLHDHITDAWLVYSGRVDSAEAQLLWDRGEQKQAILRFRQVQALYEHLDTLPRGAEPILVEAGKELIKAYLTEGNLQGAVRQAEKMLAHMPLTCPRDAMEIGELLHHLLPVVGDQTTAANVFGLVAQVKSKLSTDNNEHAPLWFMISSIEAEFALRSGDWNDVLRSVVAAVRWVMDIEAVAFRQLVFETLGGQIERLQEQQPDVAVDLCRQLKNLLDTLPPPPHEHQQKSIMDWYAAVCGGAIG